MFFTPGCRLTDLLRFRRGAEPNRAQAASKRRGIIAHEPGQERTCGALGAASRGRCAGLLRLKRYANLARQFREQIDEIDIVVRRVRTFVVVKVKARSDPHACRAGD